MKVVQPKVFLIAEPVILEDNLQEYLRYLGAPEWNTDAKTPAEKLAEVMGRVCYNSFAVGLNPNVIKIREGSRAYLGNVIEGGHGSVFEHVMVSFIIVASRIFTHELVRHRVGVGISQQSLRYVRFKTLPINIPTVIQENEEALTIYTKAVRYLEIQQRRLSKIFNLDDPETSFKTKKIVTSAIRRIAPSGLVTTIGWSANFRTLRWVLETRTSPQAEEEMRIVFGQVGKIVLARYPNIFSDFSVINVDGLDWYKPKYSKV